MVCSTQFLWCLYNGIKPRIFGSRRDLWSVIQSNSWFQNKTRKRSGRRSMKWMLVCVQKMPCSQICFFDQNALTNSRSWADLQNELWNLMVDWWFGILHSSFKLYNKYVCPNTQNGWKERPFPFGFQTSKATPKHQPIGSMSGIFTLDLPQQSIKCRYHIPYVDLVSKETFTTRRAIFPLRFSCCPTAGLTDVLGRNDILGRYWGAVSTNTWRNFNKILNTCYILMSWFNMNQLIKGLWND